MERTLTLRDDPVELVKPEGGEEAGERQVDLRRQQVSIKETKESLLGLIGAKSTFMGIYERYRRGVADTSPTICFLTMLHLANEHNLQFCQHPDETDFDIRS